MFRTVSRLCLPLLMLVALGLAPSAASAGSADVAALQVALGAAGLSPGAVDGVSGPATRSATRSFQARRGLAADGIAGPRTRRRLGRLGKHLLGSRPLRVGQRGWDVSALQFLLNARGFAPGTLDGGFGAATRTAVLRFQRAAGLGADGVAGNATLAALRRRTVTSHSVTATPGDPVAFLRPLGAPITDGFGFVSGRRHTGLDFPAAQGRPVGAAGRGVVSFAGRNSGGYGNLVVVRHRLGYESWYAHLSRITVSVGQPVAGGTVIGAIGSTGRSTGPHLHLEVRRFGTPIDPRPRLLTTTSVARRKIPARVSRSRAARLVCAPNADARASRDADPWQARLDRCPA